MNEKTLQEWRDGKVDDIRDLCGVEVFLRIVYSDIVQTSTGFCVKTDSVRKVLQELLPVIHECRRTKTAKIFRGREMPINHPEGFTVGAITDKGTVIVHNNGAYSQYNNNCCSNSFEYQEILLLAYKLGL